MRHVGLSLALLAVDLMFVPPAWAQELGINRLHVRQVGNGGQGDLAQTVTNDLLIDFTGELRGQQIILELTQGTIYQHPQGTNLPPNPSLFPAYPNLSFDTFLSMGGKDSTSSAPVIEIPSLEFPNRFEPDLIRARWAPAGGAVIIDRNDFLTLRVTFSDNAQGKWEYVLGTRDTDPLAQAFSAGMVENGRLIVPEPSTALLVNVALFTLILCRRGAYRFRDGITHR